MREDELADTSLLRHLSALSGVQMGWAGAIGRERAIEDGKVGISAEPDECITILCVSRIHDRLPPILDPIADAREI